MNEHSEMTLAIIKPDAFKQHAVGNIISRIEEASISIIALKQIHLTESEAGMFYHVHKGKSFYDALVTFMSSGPCVVLVLQGEDVINRWRTLIGPTDPTNAPEGTIRQLYGTTVRHNAVHGSDAPETATYEISFFFSGLTLASQSHTEGEGQQ